MVSFTQIALFVASAATLVSAGPAPIAEAVPEIAREALLPEETYSNSRSITRSDDASLSKRNGELYCGAFASADYANAHMMQLNMADSMGVQHTIAPHGCLRTSCMNTSGVYVCNDRNTALTVSNAEIIPHAKNILLKCCLHKVNGQWDGGHQSGGQQFTDALGGNWNVVIAYANCNHAATQIPSSYNGGTVNGIGCRPASMYIG